MSERISLNEVKEVLLDEGDSAVNPHADIGETGESPVVEVDSSEVKREALPREETRSLSLLQVGAESDHAVIGEQVATPVVGVETPVVKREALPSEETRSLSLSHVGNDSDYAVMGETGESPVVEVETYVDRRDALPIDGAIDSPHLVPGMSPEASSKQSYRMLNSVTGVGTEGVSLERLPGVGELLSLEEMSFNESETALKAGELDEIVVLRPEEELNSSSTMDESVLVQTKPALNARSGFKNLADPEDPYHSLLKEFGDVISDNPPMELPPERGVRHEIDLVPGTKYCVTRQWPVPKEQ
ncbi:hypothetical protein PsorP6_003479 [Peronosclerospora sorghi]|uniref:Uncharacterized protein n=1 Tax=Peronosclerospora sorghi TaxID=230839 RepID=A0ACC0VPV0_9STRA|nr:hypothetical protein PsorP6_003479 [Peronosclerospora sorghi]